jgi:hypothetical protein
VAQSAGETVIASAQRGPRFLVQSGRSRVPVDLARTPLLRQRITVDLNGVPLRRRDDSLPRALRHHGVGSAEHERRDEPEKAGEGEPTEEGLTGPTGHDRNSLVVRGRQGGRARHLGLRAGAGAVPPRGMHERVPEAHAASHVLDTFEPSSHPQVGGARAPDTGA